MAFYNLSPLMQRVIGFLFLVPVAVCFAVSPVLASFLLIMMAMVMALELSLMANMTGIARVLAVIVLAAIAMPYHLLEPATIGIDIVILQSMLILIFALLVARKGGISRGAFGFVLALCMASAAALLATPDGHLKLLAAAIVIAGCDTAAYFVGRQIGGPKLAPSISPNKTISGAVGGVIGAVIMMQGTASIFGMTITEAVLAGIVMAVLAQAGDLTESALKRSAGVKDSGSIIPGHGGVLDRFDGYVLTLPVLFLYVSYTSP